jgi:hypothetical protein
MAGEDAGTYMAVHRTGGFAMRRCITAVGVAAVGAFALMVLALMVPLGAGPAWGRPMDGALQQQLMAAYQRYNQAIAAGHLDAALAMRSSAVRTALEQRLKTPKDRDDYLAGARDLVPDKLELRHASVDDTTERALLIAWANKVTASGPVQNELDIGFVREDGTWKLGDLVLGPGPTDIKHCNPGYESVSAYDMSRPVSLAGRIERVDFQADHTLIVVVAGGTETCAFLPDRAALQQHGLDPAILLPYRVAEISGVANRTDAQKVMVNNITVHAEE